MDTKTKSKNQRGFSLVELMLVVAMMGILSSIASVNFDNMVKNARHTQAKSTLVHLYTLEKLFNAEYSSYTSRLDALGFQAEGTLYYDIGFAVDFAPPAGAPPGNAACRTLCSAVGCPMTRTWTCTASAQNSLDGSFATSVSATRFTAGAHAHFKTGTTNFDPYSWAIDETKYLRMIIPSW